MNNHVNMPEALGRIDNFIERNMSLKSYDPVLINLRREIEDIFTDLLESSRDTIEPVITDLVEAILSTEQGDDYDEDKAFERGEKYFKSLVAQGKL